MDCTYNCILRVRYANPILKLKQPATNSKLMDRRVLERNKEVKDRETLEMSLSLPPPINTISCCGTVQKTVIES